MGQGIYPLSPRVGVVWEVFRWCQCVRRLSTKMSKLSFRARALDASKPMPIYMSEELPDLPEYSAINRAVPQMPSGMEKEEECEHHLQRAIVTGLIIPTPEVTHMGDQAAYDRLYPANYKVPRQLIHMQPFTMEHDIPDYDMDSEDERWVNAQAKTMDITPNKFEEMMDRLEKNSGHSVVTQSEAKVLLKEDDDLIIAVYDYWLNKRLRTQQPLIPCVKTEAHRGGNNNNPYLAFRRRTEKMQTRKNRKNDETSYEKMVKLKRDLSRALTLLELIKRRENTKRELLHLTIEIYEKRYQANDMSGQLLAEVSAMKSSRPAFAPLFTNQFGIHNHTTNWVKSSKEDLTPRKEKRQYKKRKHKSSAMVSGSILGSGLGDLTGLLSSGDDEGHTVSPQSPQHDEAPFAFRRNKLCQYQAPVCNGGLGNWPWCSRDEGGLADRRYRYSLTSVATPKPRCIGFARRRVGRGGRIILDRAGPSMDDFWASLDFTIHDKIPANDRLSSEPSNNWTHFRPKTPPKDKTEIEEPSDLFSNNVLSLQVEDMLDTSNDQLTTVQLNLAELFPTLADSIPLDTGDLDLDTKQTVKSEDCKKFDFSIEPRLSSNMESRISRIDSTELSSDLRSVDVKDLIGCSEILLDRLSNNSEQVPKREKLASLDNVGGISRKNLSRVFSGERRENKSGSLLDRWARFETNPEPSVAGFKRKAKSPIESFVCDDSVGCSAFKTSNTCKLLRQNHVRTCPKWLGVSSMGATVTLEPASLVDNSVVDKVTGGGGGGVSSIVDVANDLNAVNSVRELLTSDRFSLPSSPTKEIPQQPQSQKTTPPHNNTLRNTHTATVLSNGTLNTIDLGASRLIQLSNSVVTTYRKNNMNLHAVNNKVLTRLPADITGEVLDGAATGAPVDKKPNQSLVRKNNSLPMEVT